MLGIWALSKCSGGLGGLRVWAPKRVVYYFCLVPVPNVNEMVFARILTEFEESFPVKPHILVRFEKDGIYFLPYQGIKELLKKG